MPRRSVLLRLSLVALTAALVACSAVAAFLSVRETPPPLEAVPGTSIDLGDATAAAQGLRRGVDGVL
jgi:hypothetical protein